MLLLAVALGGLGFWFWYRLRKSGRKVPAAWLGIAGTLIGTIMMTKGMAVTGALVATVSGLWLRFGDSLAGGRAPSPAPLSARDLSRAEAADLLGVSINASRDEIIAAHRKLIARNHPDAGGSPGLAARINAARDTLLKSQET
ncbi:MULTISPECIES: molecular chaperone DnaJ [Sphingobium]|uniref:molecular chaperone DnaJ n=1 Tax=Sphingobium TaxID=165695 RepID=UPI0015ECC6CC|nr:MULTISPECIES: molecular chaperone DnaJ [Sphingobium]MCW2363042.1 hypothetical protein [Sphingobium sp. B10D3B]MCW2367561.1 hypothetical protein [Sphingobium sp. B7D2B]MCW2400278.1 hypothetical protein [Sphingobium sp. B10D7B]MCW2407256.1 hypothetical protein [Sphingobium xanthum]